MISTFLGWPYHYKNSLSFPASQVKMMIKHYKPCFGGATYCVIQATLRPSIEIANWRSCEKCRLSRSWFRLVMALNTRRKRQGRRWRQRQEREQRPTASNNNINNYRATPTAPFMVDSSKFVQWERPNRIQLICFDGRLLAWQQLLSPSTSSCWRPSQNKGRLKKSWTNLASGHWPVDPNFHWLRSCGQRLSLWKKQRKCSKPCT